MSDAAVYQLRLPKSLKEAVRAFAAEDGVSMNQFMASAVAEKLSVLQTMEFFEDRRARLDYSTFDKVMSRTDGEAPSEGDELPE